MSPDSLTQSARIHNANQAALEAAWKRVKAVDERVFYDLLSKGARVDARTSDGATALLLTCAGSGRQAVKYWSSSGVHEKLPAAKVAGALLSQGADVHARDNLGQTALILAAKFRTYAIDKERNDWGEAAALETVRVLLKHGADVNARTQNGNTALKWATLNGRNQIVQLLRQAGAR